MATQENWETSRAPQEDDHQERLRHRPPFQSGDWDYNDIIEGRYDLHTGYDEDYEMRWLVYLGLDSQGNPTTYDEVTVKRYLGDVKPLGDKTNG